MWKLRWHTDGNNFSVRKSCDQCSGQGGKYSNWSIWLSDHRRTCSIHKLNKPNHTVDLSTHCLELWSNVFSVSAPDAGDVWEGRHRHAALQSRLCPSSPVWDAEEGIWSPAGASVPGQRLRADLQCGGGVVRLTHSITHLKSIGRHYWLKQTFVPKMCLGQLQIRSSISSPLLPRLFLKVLSVKIVSAASRLYDLILAFLSTTSWPTPPWDGTVYSLYNKTLQEISVSSC